MTHYAINIVVTPAYSKTNWFSDFYKGVSSKSGSAKINTILYNNNSHQILEICSMTNNYVILVSSSSA